MSSKLEINAAIEHLLGGTEPWQDAARLIIEFMKKSRPTGIFSAENISNVSDDTPVEGFALGVGNVQVHNETKETREWSFGINKERVGYYKLYREGKNLIIIQPFWKAEIATNVDEKFEEYVLAYNPHTLNPNLFGKKVSFSAKVPFVELYLVLGGVQILKGRGAGKLKFIL